MRLLHLGWMAVLLLTSTAVIAQQVKFIDLTTTVQRVQLRYPPAPPVENGVGGGSVSGSVGDCGPDIRDPRSLTVYVQSVITSNEDSTRPFEIEFKILNTGTVPLLLPLSPHLSDLQPEDSSARFTYFSLALSVSPVEDRSSIGYVELYGKADAPNTVMMLNPGEWLRLEARVKFNSWKLPPAGTVNLVPGYWLRRVTFQPRPGGYSSAAENICVNENPTPTVSVHRN